MQASRLRARREQFVRNVCVTQLLGTADDRGEPFGGYAVEIDPPPDVLGRDAEPLAQGGDIKPAYDRGEEHSLEITRNVTHGNTIDVEQQAIDARRRLRELRRERGLSIDRLAALVERSPSSIRAHENGQNGINAQAADLYARALGVSPSYILWGEDGVPADAGDASARLVSILGEVAGDVWLEGYSLAPIGDVVVSLPEYAHVELSAFLVGRKSRFYRRGDYVVVAPLDVGVRALDHVVVLLSDTVGKTKINLMEVDLTLAGLALRPIAGGADRVGVRDLFNRETAKDDVRVTVLGPVVAYGGRDRPATGPVIPATQFVNLHRLS